MVLSWPESLRKKILEFLVTNADGFDVEELRGKPWYVPHNLRFLVCLPWGCLGLAGKPLAEVTACHCREFLVGDVVAMPGHPDDKSTVTSTRGQRTTVKKGKVRATEADDDD